jgi:acyl-phosphate glycerol 3-phosphate acyltransferase
MIFYIIVCFIIGYAVGCFSTGYLVGKANHIDIRKSGSGNAGATNTLRTLGIKAGLITFLGDAFKAIIPIVLIRLFVHDTSISWQLLSLYMGLGVVIGHNFPFWLNFKGGKGIAATAGVILAVADYRVTLIGLILFILIVAITRYVSIGSLMVAFLLPINTVIFYRNDKSFLHMLIVSLLFTMFAYLRHKENIKRLCNGTERKIGKH